MVAYFVGFKLGQDQAHQRIADVWNQIFGEEPYPQDLSLDISGGIFVHEQDPFGPSNADPFANSLGPFQSGDASGNGTDSDELFETNSTK